MAEIVVTEFVTLDGVMEAPGGEPSHPHTGWVGELFSPELEAYKFQEVKDAGAHLLGRVTYESFAGAWPTYEGEFADLMNAIPKHVVSTTLRDPEWNNTTVVRDLDGVRAMKAQVSTDMLVAGSATLVHALLLADLVDELRLTVFPVAIGHGLRVFPEERTKTTWALTDLTTLPNGVVAQTYRRA